MTEAREANVSLLKCIDCRILDLSPARPPFATSKKLTQSDTLRRYWPVKCQMLRDLWCVVPPFCRVENRAAYSSCLSAILSLSLSLSLSVCVCVCVRVCVHVSLNLSACLSVYAWCDGVITSTHVTAMQLEQTRKFHTPACHRQWRRDAFCQVRD